MRGAYNYGTMLAMRRAILQNATDKVAQIENTFHFEWLHAVPGCRHSEEENQRYPAGNNPQKAVEYSMERIKNRYNLLL